MPGIGAILHESSGNRPMANTNGRVIWEGFSPIDGSPIVLIATGFTEKSSNRKTGDEIQTWILRRDINPVVASNEGLDESICGNCPHRKVNNGTCYVNVGQAPNAIWKCYTQGSGYNQITEEEYETLFSDRVVRFGSYGDPAMVPVEVWQKILSAGVKNHTGYTHQWRSEFAQGFKGIVQASCDGLMDFVDASSAGWKCFLVKPADVADPKGTAHCAASVEKGAKTTCASCHLCDGHSAHVVINAHGKRGHKVVW